MCWFWMRPGRPGPSCGLARPRCNALRGWCCASVPRRCTRAMCPVPSWLTCCSALGSTWWPTTLMRCRRTVSSCGGAICPGCRPCCASSSWTRRWPSWRRRAQTRLCRPSSWCNYQRRQPACWKSCTANSRHCEQRPTRTAPCARTGRLRWAWRPSARRRCKR